MPRGKRKKAHFDINLFKKRLVITVGNEIEDSDELFTFFFSIVNFAFKKLTEIVKKKSKQKTLEEVAL